MGVGVGERGWRRREQRGSGSSRFQSLAIAQYSGSLRLARPGQPWYECVECWPGAAGWWADGGRPRRTAKKPLSEQRRGADGATPYKARGREVRRRR